VQNSRNSIISDYTKEKSVDSKTHCILDFEEAVQEWRSSFETSAEFSFSPAWWSAPLTGGGEWFCKLLHAHKHKDEPVWRLRIFFFYVLLLIR